MVEIEKNKYKFYKTKLKNQKEKLMVKFFISK